MPRLVDAAYEGSSTQVRKYLSYGDNPNLKDLWGYTPILEAVRRGHFDIVEILLENNADCSIKCSSGFTPLEAAFSELDKRQRIVDLLKQHGEKS